jgi:hypothetical protein
MQFTKVAILAFIGLVAAAPVQESTKEAAKAK